MCVCGMPSITPTWDNRQKTKPDNRSKLDKIDKGRNKEATRKKGRRNKKPNVELIDNSNWSSNFTTNFDTKLQSDDI